MMLLLLGFQNPQLRLGALQFDVLLLELEECKNVFKINLNSMVKELNNVQNKNQTVFFFKHYIKQLFQILITIFLFFNLLVLIK